MIDQHCTWTEFYIKLANELQSYKDNRQALIKKLQVLYESIGMKFPKLDSSAIPADIDPYTVYGLFNKGISEANRKKIIAAIAEAFDIKVNQPDDFDGIPVLNNLNATFYAFVGDDRRGEHDIDNLWRVFEAELALAADDNAENRKSFVEAFNNAASEAAVTPRVASLAQGERTIRGLEDSRDVARWAYGAEVGDVSEIFPVGKDYVIAMLTEIDDNEFAPLEKVSAQIRAQVLRDKKYDYIVKELSGSTLDEQAKSLGTEVADFDNVTFGAFYVNGPGFEPRLIGAISSTTEKGVLSAPVKGLSGVYVFEVDDIQTSDKQTAEGEKVRAQAMAESMAQQFSVQAIQQMANIQDLLKVTNLSTADRAQVQLYAEEARLNAAKIKDDGSWGVHAPKFAKQLVDEATTYTTQALAILNAANKTAKK